MKMKLESIRYIDNRVGCCTGGQYTGGKHVNWMKCEMKVNRVMEYLYFQKFAQNVSVLYSFCMKKMYLKTYLEKLNYRFQ